MRRIQFVHTYEDIISVENLLAAWREFVKGKREKADVLGFQINLMSNILALHCELKAKTYRHGKYKYFRIADPKPRDIHKATVRDRLLHHALYRKLYPFFDRMFIADSYSCRRRKGTHRAMNRFRSFAYRESKNHTRAVWVLKCDIRKFFASIDQSVLMDIVSQHISDADLVWLIGRVVESFDSGVSGKGLPLGNLTSQLLVNVYLNEFDQYVKHELKAAYYIRYADDFVILSRDRAWLAEMLQYTGAFLREKLRLELHPGKVSIRTLASGVDFLGFVHFPDHRVLRTSTKRKMLRRASRGLSGEAMQSYLGMLRHGNTSKLQREISS